MSDTVATMGDAGKAMPVPRGQYSDTETYEYLDFVYCGDASYIAKKLTTGNPPAEDNEYWQLFARGGTLTENSDVSNTTVTFEQAENRANIFSKESLKTMAGKVSKMYSDLKSIAFSGKYTDLEGRVTITNNDLATIPGTAWDAVRGAQIRKDLDKLNSDFTNYIYKNLGSGDVNNIKTNFHKFVYNMQNTPESYGFLDVSKFDGSGFSPSVKGVIRQRFTGWNTGNEYTRCFYSDKWTPWISDVWKVQPSNIIVGLTEQTITLQENAKYAKEVIAFIYVEGAPDLCRSIVLVPNIIQNAGAYLYRSDAQKASIYVQLIDNKIFVAAHILYGLTIQMSHIMYR